jgi:hypothetical protein
MIDLGLSHDSHWPTNRINIFDYFKSLGVLRQLLKFSRPENDLVNGGHSLVWQSVSEHFLTMRSQLCQCLFDDILLVLNTENYYYFAIRKWGSNTHSDNLEKVSVPSHHVIITIAAVQLLAPDYMIQFLVAHLCNVMSSSLSFNHIGKKRIQNL